MTIKRIIEEFNLALKYVAADAGYSTMPLIKQLSGESYKAIFGFRMGPHVLGKFTKLRFQYVKELDIHVNYKTTSRSSYNKYASSDC